MARIEFRNHPYTEGGIKNEPILITREKLGYFTYPDFDIPHSDLNTLLVSTPNLFAAYFALAPGCLIIIQMMRFILYWKVS